MSELKIITTNDGKWEEFKAMLEPHGYRLIRINAKLREIQTDDIAKIAMTCCEEGFTKFGGQVIVEDAGLYINHLNGFPGPYSSYVYSTIGVSGILRLMEGAKDRRAKFVSALAYASEGVGVMVFIGECLGVISCEPRGMSGFGFDPIFIPNGYDKTFAELGMEEKNRISHRAMAVSEFLKWYRSYLRLPQL